MDPDRDAYLYTLCQCQHRLIDHPKSKNKYSCTKCACMEFIELQRSESPTRQILRLIAMRIREKGDTGNEQFDLDATDVAAEYVMTAIASIIEEVLDMYEEDLERAIELQTKYERDIYG